MRLEQPSPEVIAIVTDIEGTTSDIAFLHDVLLPYARHQMPAWVREHADQPDIAAVLDDARTQASEPDADTGRVIELLMQWMDAGDKATPLQTLQARIWQQGYEQGDFHGHVYPDAVAALQAWADDRRALFVYSSGPVVAQKLLFGHSDHGDLTGLFSGYFDTGMGPGKAIASYRAIAQTLGEDPAQLLFLSDTGDKLDAAATAGWQTCWVARSEQTQDKAHGNQTHPVVTSFDDIELV